MSRTWTPSAVGELALSLTLMGLGLFGDGLWWLRTVEFALGFIVLMALKGIERKES